MKSPASVKQPLFTNFVNLAASRISTIQKHFFSQKNLRLQHSQAFFYPSISNLSTLANAIIEPINVKAMTRPDIGRIQLRDDIACFCRSRYTTNRSDCYRTKPLTYIICCFHNYFLLYNSAVIFLICSASCQIHAAYLHFSRICVNDSFCKTTRSVSLPATWLCKPKKTAQLLLLRLRKYHITILHLFGQSRVFETDTLWAYSYNSGLSLIKCPYPSQSFKHRVYPSVWNTLLDTEILTPN